ncbi:C40 family peptidase [Patescibacteria group bacterium]|nr:C40 family peptidase [Patescibacteria group bacterium]MBU1915588.1 C40 family peptidase [Patescibacteria group bacterium]
MIYTAVEQRCAVSFGEMNLPIDTEKALSILLSLPGFRLVQSGFNPDCLNVIRELIGQAKYKRRARRDEAPNYFDCSSLTQWFYGQLGVQLPRRSLQQFEQIGHHVSPFAPFRYGDLLFSQSSGHNYFRNDPSFGVGHVAVVSGTNKVLQATKEGVVERDILSLFNPNFRGARRVVKDPEDFYVFDFSPDREIMSSDDIYFLLLDQLKKAGWG